MGKVIVARDGAPRDGKLFGQRMKRRQRPPVGGIGTQSRRMTESKTTCRHGKMNNVKSAKRQLAAYLLATPTRLNEQKQSVILLVQDMVFNGVRRCPVR